MTETATAIEFCNVSKTYDKITVIDRLNLQIPAGKITVFVGPSGCGKTTCLRLINRMVEPDTGQILVSGQINTVQPAYLLRRSIGYVMQQTGLLPHRTVLDNIATVPLLNGMSKKDAHSKAYAIMEKVGLDKQLAKRFPTQLSGGQAQRVGVARALAADSPILLMDEPFSAVDPVIRTELQAELIRLQMDLRRTIVFVTHDIEEAVALGDYIAVFNTGGKVMQFGAPAEILKTPENEFVAEFVSGYREARRLNFADAVAALEIERAARYRMN